MACPALDGTALGLLRRFIMTRRTVELLMALALGTVGTMVVFGLPSSPLPHAKAPLCEPEAGAAVEVATAEPAREGAGLGDVWDGVAALGNVPLGGVHRVEVAPGRPAEVEFVLTPYPRACGDLVDGRCIAGCFEVMAAAEFDGVLDVEVSPLEDPTDVIASNLQPGPVIAAGHCRGFALGHTGVERVRARVSASEGQGTVQLAAWRSPDPESVPSAELTLRLPRLGTTKARVLAETPQCASHWDDERRECEFHGSVGPLPLSETCRDGCTWWTYRFDQDDRLAFVELSRSVVDVDDVFVGKFIDEAGWIAGALDRVLGASSEPESLETWAEVESPTKDHHEPIVLQRRTWVRADATTTWEVVGGPGHHPLVELHVTMTAPRSSRG